MENKNRRNGIRAMALLLMMLVETFLCTVAFAQFTAILTRMMYPSEVEESSAAGEWWAKNLEVAETDLPTGKPVGF